MARDSSPFAKRLKKAISQRSGGQAQDASPIGAEPTAPEPEAVLPDEPQSSSAGAPPDEQPTGEFPALTATDTVASPVPDAPVDPIGQAPAGPVADDEQPTGDVPAVTPSWLDPPAADPIAPANTAGVDQSGVSEHAATYVDWATPADDVYEPAPTASTGAEAPASDSPYLPDPAAPIWEAEAAAAPPSQDDPLPIWDTIEPATPSAAGGPSEDAVPAPHTDDATPAWAEEAEAIGETSGPVVPPPLTGYDASASGPASAPTSDGPTLSPPVLPKKAPVEEPAPAIADAGDHPTAAEGAVESESEADTPSTHDAHAAALAALPDESEPVWTPTALHEALSLDEDDDATPSDTVDPPDEADAELVAEETPSASTDETVPPADPEPSKRGRRSPFGRRKRADSTPDPLPSEPEPTALHPQPAGSDSAPLTESTTAYAVEEPAEAPSPDTTDSAVGPFVDDAPEPDGVSDDLPAEAPADPGSITSRFAAIGRRALSRKEAKAAAATAAAQAAADAAAYTATLPGATPGPEAQEPTPVPFAPPADYKVTFSERAALRRRVKSLRARRDAGLAELGAIVLDQSRFGDPTGGTLVRRRTALLADLDSEIAAIEAALDESGPPEAVAQLGVVHCASCNALVGPADRFCASCGTARPAAEAGAAPSDA